MHVPVIDRIAKHSQKIADQNRQRLRSERVFAVNLIGAPGCGKTSLIYQTMARLMHNLRIGVIACDPSAAHDASRLAAYSDQILQVDTGEGHLLESGHVQDAIRKLDLKDLDLLIIENVSSTIGPAELDLGESAKVGMFSTTEGDEKVDKYPDLVGRSGANILNKLDLLPMVPFNVGNFRADIERINPRASVFEMSVQNGEGVEPWLGWLREHIFKQPSAPSQWFG